MGSPFRNLFDTLTDGLRNAASPDFVEHQLLAIQIQSKAGFLGESWRGPLVGLRAWRMEANEVRLIAILATVHRLMRNSKSSSRSI